MGCHVIPLNSVRNPDVRAIVTHDHCCWTTSVNCAFSTTIVAWMVTDQRRIRGTRQRRLRLNTWTSGDGARAARNVSFSGTSVKETTRNEVVDDRERKPARAVDSNETNGENESGRILYGYEIVLQLQRRFRMNAFLPLVSAGFPPFRFQSFWLRSPGMQARIGPRYTKTPSRGPSPSHRYNSNTSGGNDGPLKWVSTGIVLLFLPRKS